MAPRTVLCFGDSNTHGTCAMRWPGDRRRLPRQERWPEIMAAELGEGWEVIAEGHPGRTSVFADPIEGSHKNGQLALPVLLESHRPLDLVILMLGTNDLKARFGVSAYDISLGVQRLALQVRASDCGQDGDAPAVMIAAPAEVLETGIFAEMFVGATAKSQALPAHLKTIAETLNTAFVDINAVAKVDPADGIHLDAAAHAAIGKRMAEAVTAALPATQEGAE